MNALKHGLTGQRLILQPEEHQAFRELHPESLHAELQPKTTMELQLVQKLIDTHMRLNRVAALDNNMLNLGLIENLTEPDQADDTQIAWAQSRSFIAQQLSFDKLGRYEGRLSRQLIAYTKELERLQAVRNKNEEAMAERRLFEGRAPLISHRIAGLPPHYAETAASTPVSQSEGAAKGQDLSPQSPTAQHNQWSLGSTVLVVNRFQRQIRQRNQTYRTPPDPRSPPKTMS